MKLQELKSERELRLRVPGMYKILISMKYTHDVGLVVWY